MDHGAIVALHDGVEFLGDNLALSPRLLPLMSTENIHIFHDWGGHVPAGYEWPW